MPITSKWYDEKHNILLIAFDGDWSLSDFHQSVDDTRIITKNITHPFLTIADFTSSSTPPRNMISASSNVAKDVNPNYIGTVLVRPGLLLQMLHKVMSSVPNRQREKLAVVDNFEEALEHAAILLAEATPET